eukprot:1552182-Rhodomonas_salina.5
MTTLREVKCKEPRSPYCLCQDCACLSLISRRRDAYLDAYVRRILTYVKAMRFYDTGDCWYSA